MNHTHISLRTGKANRNTDNIQAYSFMSIIYSKSGVSRQTLHKQISGSTPLTAPHS